MKTDTIKALFTYGAAFILAIAGPPFLYLVATNPTASQQSGLLIPLISGFVASALTFLFGQEIATRTARATERALLTPSPTQPTVSVTTNGEPTP
jgi:hypothetical protein